MNELVMFTNKGGNKIGKIVSIYQPPHTDQWMYGLEHIVFVLNTEGRQQSVAAYHIGAEKEIIPLTTCACSC